MAKLLFRNTHDLRFKSGLGTAVQGQEVVAVLEAQFIKNGSLWWALARMMTRSEDERARKTGFSVCAFVHQKLRSAEKIQEVRMQQSRTVADRFHIFATRASVWVGSKWAFAVALATIVVWGALGPHFRYSDTWQLVVNTATTIVTFLMVFLIQNTQNRDAKAFHLKLDEVIRAIRSANNQMIDIEKLSDGELEELAGQFEKIRATYERRKERDRPDRPDRR